MNRTGALSIRPGFIHQKCGSVNGFMVCSLTVPHTLHKMIRNGVVVGEWNSLFMQENP